MSMFVVTPVGITQTITKQTTTHVIVILIMDITMLLIQNDQVAMPMVIIKNKTISIKMGTIKKMSTKRVGSHTKMIVTLLEEENIIKKELILEGMGKEITTIQKISIRGGQMRGINDQKEAKVESIRITLDHVLRVDR